MWISVNDRLPNSNKKVLVYCKNERDEYVGVGYYRNWMGKYWFDSENKEPFEVCGYEVTHWMPLPEPPKE